MSRIVRNKPKSLGPLPVAGKIKIGRQVPIGGGKSRPEALDHFIATGRYAAHFDRAFPEKTSQLTITFASDDPSFSCSERLELRSKDGLVARGDGVQFEAWSSHTDSFEPFTPTDPEAWMKQAAEKAGKPWYVVLDLRFIIPAIRDVAAVWHLSTKGERSSVPAIRDTFDQVLESAGTVMRIPFDLNVEIVKGQGLKARRFPVISLVPNIGDDAMEQVRAMLDSGERIRGLLTQERLIGGGKEYETSVHRGDHAKED